MRAGARSEIDHVIGPANRFFVVLNDQYGVAKIAQRRKCIEQTPVVARMESNRWLIEHVKHSAKLRSNLSSQTNSLPFTTRQRRRRPIERQVSKSYRFQKSQPGFDLPQNESGNLPFALAELDLIERPNRIFDRHRGVIGNPAPAHAHRKRIRAQTTAAAFAAHNGRNHLFQCNSDSFGGGIVQTLAQPWQGAFPITLVGIQTLAEFQLRRKTFEESLANFLGQLAEVSARIDFEMIDDGQ